MKIVAILLVSLAPMVGPNETLKGRLAIGEDVYAVSGDLWTDGEKAVHFSLDLSRTGQAPDHSLTAVLSQHENRVFVDGNPYLLPPSTAAAWLRQLRKGFQPDVPSAEFNCRLDGNQKTCDSRTIIPIDDSLSGRLRLIYDKERLIGIRFFSLAEWNNPFLAYLSLSVDIK